MGYLRAELMLQDYLKDSASEFLMLPDSRALFISPSSAKLIFQWMHHFYPPFHSPSLNIYTSVLKHTYLLLNVFFTKLYFTSLHLLWLIYLYGEKVISEECPKYLKLKFDKTLTYNQHLEGVNNKFKLHIS